LTKECENAIINIELTIKMTCMWYNSCESKPQAQNPVKMQKKCSSTPPIVSTATAHRQRPPLEARIIRRSLPRQLPAWRLPFHDLAQVWRRRLWSIGYEDGRDGRSPSGGGEFGGFGMAMRRQPTRIMAVGRRGVPLWGRCALCGWRVRCKRVRREWVKVRAAERR